PPDRRGRPPRRPPPGPPGPAPPGTRPPARRAARCAPGGPRRPRAASPASPVRRGRARRRSGRPNWSTSAPRGAEGTGRTRGYAGPLCPAGRPRVEIVPHPGPGRGGGGSAQMPREEVHGDVHRLPPPRSEGVPLTGIGAQLDVRPGRLEGGGGLTGPPRRAGVVGRAVMDLQRVGGPGGMGQRGHLAPEFPVLLGRAVLGLDPLDDRISVGPLE